VERFAYLFTVGYLGYLGCIFEGLLAHIIFNAKFGEEVPDGF
jgi:hypothetical protein